MTFSYCPKPACPLFAELDRVRRPRHRRCSECLSLLVFVTA